MAKNVYSLEECEMYILKITRKVATNLIEKKEEPFLIDGESLINHGSKLAKATRSLIHYGFVDHDTTKKVFVRTQHNYLSSYDVYEDKVFFKISEKWFNGLKNEELKSAEFSNGEAYQYEGYGTRYDFKSVSHKNYSKLCHLSVSNLLAICFYPEAFDEVKVAGSYRDSRNKTVETDMVVYYPITGKVDNSVRSVLHHINKEASKNHSDSFAYVIEHMYPDIKVVKAPRVIAGDIDHYKSGVSLSKIDNEIEQGLKDLKAYQKYTQDINRLVEEFGSFRCMCDTIVARLTLRILKNPDDYMTTAFIGMASPVKECDMDVYEYVKDNAPLLIADESGCIRNLVKVYLEEL
jgi:hypothetical protein